MLRPRGMHDHGSDDVYIIVTDMKRQEMEDVTAYFQLVCAHTAKPHPIKPSVEREILCERTLPCILILPCTLSDGSSQICG
jgi:hypothetical protein